MLWRKDLFDVGRHDRPEDVGRLPEGGAAAQAQRPPDRHAVQPLQRRQPQLARRSCTASAAKETDPSGQQIAIDSKETREALQFAKALYDEGMTAEVFSWDDASDNRYLASGVASWIHDAISAFRTTEDTNPDVFKNTYMLPEAAGPGGLRENVADANVYAIWKFSKNAAAAKEYLAAL